MTKLTDEQLKIIRSENQRTDLYLGIYEPNIVFGAQINSSSITKGEVNIPYDNVTTGSYLNVKSGMTAYIGTTQYGDDVGRVRVRSITSGTITVAIDNSINYSDNLFITVREFYEVWSVFPRATVSDNNIVTYYKDYDIPYTDQNSLFRPTPILGGHYFGWANETYVTGTINNSVYFTATGSYCVDGSPILTYFWEFPTGCIPQNSQSGTVGYVNFPSSGNYTVSCTVSAINTGTTQTGYRHIALFDRPGRGKNIPILDWELKDLSGDWQIGYTAKVEVGEGADRFRDGYLVGIWADDYYNGIKQSFGGYPNREHILFVGYVNKADTVYNAYNSRTTFLLKGIVPLLANREMFSVSLETSPNPTNWTQIKDMTIKKILDHYLRYHSTIFLSTDVNNITQPQGDYPEQYEDITKGEFLSNIQSLLQNRLFANFASDRQGRIFAEIDYNLIPTGSRPASVMTFENSDWINEPKFEEIMDLPVSSVLLGGVSYNRTTNTSSAYLSKAPGIFPSYIGKSETISGLTLESQSQLNVLSGLYFGKQNARINNFQQDLNYNMRNIDIVPQEYYTRNIGLFDTFRRIVWQNRRFLPRRISYKYSNGSLVASTTWEIETYDSPGVTINIPVTAPSASRPRYIPKNTRPPKQPASTNVNQSDGSLVYVATTDMVARTRNFNSDNPTWTNVKGAITGNIVDFILDPFDPKNKAWCLTTTGVWKTTSLDATVPMWTTSITTSQINSLIGGTLSQYRAIKANITASGNIIFSCRSQSGYDIGFLFYTINDGITWNYTNVTGDNVGNYGLGALDWGQRDTSTILYGWSNGRSFNRSELQKSTNSGFSFSGLSGEEIWNGLLSDAHIPYDDNPNYQIFYILTVNKIYRTMDGGNSWSDITPNGFANLVTAPRYMIHSYTGNRQIMMVTDGTSLWFSSNAGTTWTLQSTFLPSCALGGFPYNSGRTYRLRNANITSINLSSDPAIWTSLDNGATWLNKTGNWASAIGDFNYGIMIVPVWVSY